MANNPKVSIVVVTYNHDKYIRQALESFLQQQTNFDFEIVVADDCSTDKTQEIIREFADAHPDIFKITLRKKNIGVVPNFMGAMRAATGKYLALCEGDDYWVDSKKLQTQADFLDRHSGYALCFHPVKVVFENGKSDDFIFPEDSDSSKFTLEELLNRNFIQTNSVMYRKQNYNTVPDNILPLDWYLHVYHARFGTIGFINKVMSVYRRHPAGLWSDSHNSEFWEKYGIQRLSMFVEIAKLFREDKEKSSLIELSIHKRFTDLLEADINYDLELVNTAVQMYPEFVQSYLQFLYLQIQQAKHLAKEHRRIERTYEEDLAKVQQELVSIKSSRYWKVRLAIGRLIRK